MVKYAIAGTLILTVLGTSAFVYLNLASTEQAEAGNNSREKAQAKKSYAKGFIDLSHLTIEEMQLLSDRDFIRDTIRKEYPSVKWNLNNSMSHLTLEVTNNQHEFSLELFDLNGSRVLYFANLSTDKIFVDKLELVPNHQYNYLVRNSAGEMHAGNLSFN